MVFYDPVFGICFLPEILTTVGRIHISRKKHTGETDVLDLDSDAEHQSEKSEHPVQLNKILNYWQLVRVAYKIKILHCGILICRSGTQLSWQSTRLISERPQVRFLPFRWRNGFNDPFRKFSFLVFFMTHPFATRTILLRAVRDRPVVFAAERGIRRKTIW